MSLIITLHTLLKRLTQREARKLAEQQKRNRKLAVARSLVIEEERKRVEQRLADLRTEAVHEEHVAVYGSAVTAGKLKQINRLLEQLG